MFGQEDTVIYVLVSEKIHILLHIFMAEVYAQTVYSYIKNNANFQQKHFFVVCKVNRAYNKYFEYNGCQNFGSITCEAIRPALKGTINTSLNSADNCNEEVYKPYFRKDNSLSLKGK